MRYFKKALVSQNQVKTRHGKTIAWEVLPGNTGIIALDETEKAELIEDLDKIVGTRGVVPITEAGYEELKKNRQSYKSAPKLDSYGGPIRVLPPRTGLPKLAGAVSVAEGVKVEISNQVEAAVAKALENTKPPGGDATLAASVVPPARTPNLSRRRAPRTTASAADIALTAAGLVTA